MKKTDKATGPLVETRLAVCRSCGCEDHFTFAGIQEIPPRVAVKLGVERFSLWNCPNCGTTLSEMTLG
jgi:hypothetical protein